MASVSVFSDSFRSSTLPSSLEVSNRLKISLVASVTVLVILKFRTSAVISTLSGISNFSEERFRLLCIPGKAMPTTTV